MSGHTQRQSRGPPRPGTFQRKWNSAAPHAESASASPSHHVPRTSRQTDQRPTGSRPAGPGPSSAGAAGSGAGASSAGTELASAPAASSSKVSSVVCIVGSDGGRAAPLFASPAARYRPSARALEWRRSRFGAVDGGVPHSAGGAGHPVKAGSEPSSWTPFPGRSARTGGEMATGRGTAMATLLLLGAAASVTRADPVDDYVAAEMARQKIPGLSLAVVRDGRLERAKGYGLANLELGVVASERTVYQS